MLVDADKRLDEIPFKCMIVILDDQEKDDQSHSCHRRDSS